MSDVKNISCPNCGSIDIKIGQNGLVECQSCKGNFYVDVDSNLINAIKRLERLKRDPERNFASGYRYCDSYTKEEFYNNVLLYLRDQFLCPAYIYEESHFSDVFKTDIPIITAEGSATVSYSRVLGYDRQIAITEHKTTKYSDGTRRHSYSTHYKTETDWISDAGMLYGDAKETFIDPKFSNFVNEQELDESSLVALSDEEIDTLKIDEDVLDTIKGQIVDDVFSENITYPVDKVRNEEYSGNAKVTNISCTFVSMYSIEITVRDKQIILYACTNGNPKIYQIGDLPLNDDQDEFNKKIYDLASERDSITKKPRTIRLCSILFFTAAFITLLAVGIKKDILLLKILSILPLIIEIIIVSILNPKISKVVRQYGLQMGSLYTEREERIRKERYEAYERFINK